MNIAVIFAGGVGKRMNNAATPKQFLKLHGKEIIIYTLEKFNRCPQIDAITVACYEPWISYLRQCLEQYGLHKVKTVVPGGGNGQESIYRALLSVRTYGSDDSVVLIHDGVRPLIDERTIADNIESVRRYGSAVTVAPAIETVVQVEWQSQTCNQAANQVSEIVDRAHCRMARAPQSFVLKELLEAHGRALSENKTDFIDSASLMKYYGKELYTVEGPSENIKITTPADFYAFKAYFEAEEDSQVFGI